MAFKKLYLQTWGTFTLPKVKVVIQRQSDKTSFNLKTKTFMGTNTDSNSELFLVDLQPIIHIVSNTLVGTSLDIDPKVWTDGDYSVYFFDYSAADVPRLTDVQQISIFNGSAQTQKVPTDSDVAVRILDCNIVSRRNKPDSLAAVHLDILASLKKIENRLGI